MAEAPWRMVLLALAVAAASAWLAARTIVSHAAIERAYAEARAWPAVIATTAELGAAARCAPRNVPELGTIAGVRSATVVVECRPIGVELDVGRAEEAEAIAAEAAQTLGAGWELSTRSRLRTATIARLERSAGLGVLSATPIVLALLLVLLALGHGGSESRELVGKLKLVGFTTRQLAWLLALRTLGPCLLGALLGLGVATIAIGTGSVVWLRALAGMGREVAFSWAATLDAALAVGAFVVAPCLVAAAGPAVRLARRDPARLLEGE